jgi:hypothetical protein
VLFKGASFDEIIQHGLFEPRNTGARKTVIE